MPASKRYFGGWPAWFCTARAAASYFVLTIIFTWPLVLGLPKNIPWDLGDSLLNCWILAWDLDHLSRFVSGHFGAMHGFWNANIFYPEPLTLAYSEHLFAQAVQVLPVWMVTHNIILCYNLLFLSTFVLSGLGTFLFVREVTKSARAGFVAGLIYAFAPLRVPQFAHLQVISSQWMPFVLFGFRRYFDTRNSKHLIGAGLALIAQNLSCGYFLVFFAPCVVVYVLFEVASRRLWMDLKMWAAVAATAACVGAATLPFLMPYLELRRMGVPPRPYSEVVSYSADVYSYWTSPAESRLWGKAVRAFPKAEADLFPGITALALMLVALVEASRRSWASTNDRRLSPLALRLAPFAYGLTALCSLYALFCVLILSGHGFAQLGPFDISVKNLVRNFQVMLAALIALLAVSPRARAVARDWLGSVAGIALLLTLLTFLMSLGPEIKTMGRTLRGTAPYAFFYWHVPGFDGLRVPARYGMLVMVFMSIAAGLGAFEIERRVRRGGLIVMLVGLFAIAESFAAPIVINGTGPEADYATPPSQMMTGDSVPAVYKFLKTLPAPGTVVAEFPLGQWTYELRYVFYSASHWHPLINGYSGTFPISYDTRAALLRRPEEDPQAAWDALVKSGATHAVVHEGFYKDNRGAATSRWLLSHGARLVSEFDQDKVFEIGSARVSR